MKAISNPAIYVGLLMVILSVALVIVAIRTENELIRVRVELASRPQLGDITVHVYRNNLAVFTTIPSVIRLEVNGTLHDTGRQAMSGLDLTLPVEVIQPQEEQK